MCFTQTIYHRRNAVFQRQNKLEIIKACLNNVSLGPSAAEKIHISTSMHAALLATHNYDMDLRGEMEIKVCMVDLLDTRWR